MCREAEVTCKGFVITSMHAYNEENVLSLAGGDWEL